MFGRRVSQVPRQILFLGKVSLYFTPISWSIKKQYIKFSSVLRGVCETQTVAVIRRMDRRRYCYKDLLPFVVCVANECSNTGLFTLFKAATLQGMSNHVFVAYAYTVSTIVLFPVYFFYRRYSWQFVFIASKIISKKHVSNLYYQLAHLN